MRTTSLIVALAATFNLAFADVICKPEALHYKPRITTAAEKAGFAKSIDELCSTDETDKAIQGRFESTIFTVTRTGESFDANDCKLHFNHIIDDCLAGKNMGGGGFTNAAMVLEVSIDASSEAGEAVVKRTTKKPIVKKPTEKKPVPKTPAKTPTKPSPAPKVKPTPTPTPAGKACALKPGKGKKPGTKTIRSLISKILERGSSPKSGSPSLGCLDEPMRALPGWGDTFFGVRDELTVSPAQLLKIAEEAYKEVMAKHPTLTILVAALYVPLEGVYLGTVPHGTGMAKMKSVGPTTAPVLWEVLGDRSINDKDKSPSLYHAEDAAMWYAYQKGAVDLKKRFPAGSIMLTYGKIGGGGQAMKIKACNVESKSNIDPHCEQTMKAMNVKPA
jgi:hypothetical protein